MDWRDVQLVLPESTKEMTREEMDKVILRIQEIVSAPSGVDQTIDKRGTMSIKDKVLQVFLDFPDRELRAVDVWRWMGENGQHYASDGNMSVACAQLHRDGRLFRKREGNSVWYCIAREMR